MEELVWNAKGKLMTNGPASYKIPAVADMPLDLRLLSVIQAEERDALWSSKHVQTPFQATADMFREPACKLRYKRICTSLPRLYRSARALPGVKKILIASGLRYDLAVESPEYVKELVTHHVGG